MKKLSLLFILCTLINACSFSSSSKEEVTSRPSDELEFAVDTIADANPDTKAMEMKVEEQPIIEAKIPDEISPIEHPAEESIAAIADSKPAEGVEKEMAKPEEPKFSDYQKKETTPVAKAESEAVIPEIAPMETKNENQVSMGAEEQYHVQKGDTLMMVAFKIYGDYRKWKDLKEWNKGKLQTKIAPGIVLKYFVPGQNFGWKPSGLPYMVKTGDNLGMISMDKYGTSKKWKSIYENNRPLIRDPNLIFAGFTIYYVPTRDVASKTR